MRKRTIFLGALAGVLLLALIAAPIVLAPGTAVADVAPAEATSAEDQAAAIEAMRRPNAERPVIAIVTRNEGTEISDFLSAYGVLKTADVADVTIVAQHDETVLVYPSLRIEPDATMVEFDAAHPDGADYIVVPAMDPGTDPDVAAFIKAQREKGAHVVSICNGSLSIGTAGLLDGRRATSHWSTVPQLQAKYPTMEWVPDRRYVTDEGVTTSTGITANIPVMLALVEAIGGRDVAERVGAELGVAHWDTRHRSAAFELSLEHKKTFIRNWISVWRHETVGVPVADDVDEVALGLLVDAYSRTGLAKVVTVGEGGKPVTSKHGLVMLPEQPTESAAVDTILEGPPSEDPAMTIERELARITERYDLPTAAFVAQVMEYPWTMDSAAIAGKE